MAQTLKQARQSSIDQLDKLGTSIKDYDEANVFTAAEQDVADFIERVQANIQAQDMILTGQIDDISLIVTANEIQVLGSPHVLYQDRGVQGSVDSSRAPQSPHKYTDKMPPLSVFIEYVKKKNLVARNAESLNGKLSPFEDNTSEAAIKKLAKALQISIYKKGFRPRNIFTKEIPQLKEDLKKSIKGFAANSIREAFFNGNKL